MRDHDNERLHEGEHNPIRPNDGAGSGGTMFTALKRSVIRAGLYVRGTIGETARAVADACETGPLSTPYAKRIFYDPTQTSQSFADLPPLPDLLEHKEIGRLFDIADPFYRCHEARNGVTTLIDGRSYVNFASYDYLGLNQHPAVAKPRRRAIERFGTSVSASRIVAGERPLHRELETALAEFYGVEAAVTFVSGHATNVSTIGTLMTPDDLVLYDDLSHNSVLVGTKLSRATALAFRHNDLDALEALLG